MIDTLFPYYTDSVKDSLVTSPKLTAKVSPAGELLPFPGKGMTVTCHSEPRSGEESRE